MKLSKACQECGQSFETSRTNAKRCHICRLLNNLEFINDFTVPCWQCSDTISPLERGDKTCGHCAYTPKKHGIAVCVQCKNERPRIEHDVDVCHRCAKHPDHRKWLLNAVRKKVKARTEASKIPAAA